ncbi:MAG: iron-sulfur cluster assembly protein [Opitutae bacterium]
MSTSFTLVKDCTTTLIPAGDTVILEKGTTVTVTQALGNSITVRTNLGLFRINENDISALGPEGKNLLKSDSQKSTEGPLNDEMIWTALRGCFDPEIPINIVDLGLIYDLDIADGTQGGKIVNVKMTLTAQGCGMGPVIAADAKAKIELLAGVESAEVSIVWEPIWNPRMISEAGRKELGLE